MSNVIDIKKFISKKPQEKALLEHDDLSVPFYEFYHTDEQLSALLDDIERGSAHPYRAQDMAISITSYVSEKLRGMEALFCEVASEDVEHEDLLNVMSIGQHCHNYMNIFLPKFASYPSCLALIRTAKNSVIYQELYISRAINDLLAKKFDSKPVLRFV